MNLNFRNGFSVYQPGEIIVSLPVDGDDDNRGKLCSDNNWNWLINPRIIY